MKLLETFWAKPQVFHFISVSSMFAPTFTCSRCGSVTDTLMLTQKAACQRITQGLCYPGASLSTLCGLQPVQGTSHQVTAGDRLRPSFNYSWLTLGGLKGQFTYFLCEAAQTACATCRKSAVFTQGNDALPVGCEKDVMIFPLFLSALCLKHSWLHIITDPSLWAWWLVGPLGLLVSVHSDLTRSVHAQMFQSEFLSFVLQ